jgi:transposase
MTAFWAVQMLTQEQAVEIRVLERQGRSIRQIMRDTGLSRNTVRKYLRGRRRIVVKSAASAELAGLESHHRVGAHDLERL